MSCPLPPGSRSWRSEFRRLHYTSPSVLDAELRDHGNEVNHADISADCEMLATCGRDCQVVVYSLLGE